jgi:hypothetical protein
MTPDLLTRAWRQYSSSHGGNLSQGEFDAFKRGHSLYQPSDKAASINPYSRNTQQGRQDSALIAGYILAGAQAVAKGVCRTCGHPPDFHEFDTGRCGSSECVGVCEAFS